MHFDKQYFLDKLIYSRDAHLRAGQFVFNEVHQLFPNEVNSITGTIYDCFYLDEKIDLFLEKMRQLVESKPPSFAEFVEDLSKEGFNTNFKLLNDEKQEIDAEKQLWKSVALEIEAIINLKVKQNVMRITKGINLYESIKPKVFYRLGESMKNRKIRGGYNALS